MRIVLVFWKGCFSVWKCKNSGRGRGGRLTHLFLTGLMVLAFTGCDDEGSSVDKPCEGWQIRDFIAKNGIPVFILTRASPRKVTYIVAGGRMDNACREANRKFGTNTLLHLSAEIPTGASTESSLRGSPISASGNTPVESLLFDRYPLATVVQDLDGDLQEEIALVFEGENFVTLVRTDNSGLLAPVKFATGTNPAALIAGDINRDGKLDLVTANSGTLTGLNHSGGDVSLLLGNSDGTFQAAISIPAGRVPRDAGAGDFNEDGKLDLVVADAPFTAPHSLVLRLGNGDGTFQPATEIDVQGQVVAVVDFNVDTDNHDDVVTNGGILLGRGDGTFEAARSIPLGFPANVNVVRVADIDGDRKPDVVAGSIDKRIVSIFRGLGDGALAAPHHYHTDGPTERIEIGDLNGDGTTDIFVSNASGGQTRLLGNGNGTFQAPETYFVVNNSLSASAAAVADFTGDGVPDMVVANGGYWQGNLQTPFFGGSTATLMRGLGSARFGPPEPIPNQAGMGVAAGDWNADGHQDLAFTGQGVVRQQLFIVLGRGDGTFSAPTMIDLPGARRFELNFLLAALVNGDSAPDLLVADFEGGISPFLGNGEGGFAAQPPAPIGPAPNGIATGDFNADGKLDMAVTYLGVFGELNGGIKVALGNGDGGFQAARPVRTNAAPNSIAAADLNGDGKLDFAVALEARQFDWDVEAFLGIGDGTFAAPAAAGLNEYLLSGVAVADVDQDGKPDLAVTDGGRRVRGLRGKGDGTFERAVSAVTSGGRITVADLDRDGFPDLVAPQNGFVAVFRNPATDGGFARPLLSFLQNAGRLELAWPRVFSGFNMQEADTIASPVLWKPSTNAVNTVGDQFKAIINLMGQARFFRLERAQD